MPAGGGLGRRRGQRELGGLDGVAGAHDGARRRCQRAAAGASGAAGAAAALPAGALARRAAAHAARQDTRRRYAPTHRYAAARRALWRPGSRRTRSSFRAETAHTPAAHRIERALGAVATLRAVCPVRAVGAVGTRAAHHAQRLAQGPQTRPRQADTAQSEHFQ